MLDDRCKIAKARVDVYGFPSRSECWAVLDRGEVVSIHVSVAAAESSLRDYKQTLAERCNHPYYMSAFDVDGSGTRIVTLECTECGMVGELEIDEHADIVWIGQQ